MLLGMRSLWEKRFNQFTKVLTATLTFNGALTPRYYKTLDGAMTFTGSLTYQARIALSGALTFTGSLLTDFLGAGRRIVFHAVHKIRLILHDYQPWK